MAELREVMVRFVMEDEPGFIATVSVDGQWNEIADEEDEKIFFYFASESEFQAAKSLSWGEDFIIEELGQEV